MGYATKEDKDRFSNSGKDSPSSINKREPLGDEEDLTCSQKWRGYPKHVLFIVGMEFCERFSYYGMRSVLLLYLRNYLLFNDDVSTAVYHAFTVLAYFTPVFGAIVADSYWGKFKTIWLLSLFYIAGHLVKTVGSIPLIPSATVHVVLSMIGLVLIAFGTGGIKPCVSSFGGDQFKPEQTEFRKQFFSLFYFAINAGSLISTFLTPILRADVDCYPSYEGSQYDECYALAFGVPAALMVVALVLFIAGSRWYVKFSPQGSIFWKFCHCIGSGIKHWWKTPRNQRNKEHWLDNAKASPKMIKHSKYVLRVLVLFIPLPFFWALFDQQGSRWTLQAIELDGNLGSLHLLPDQIETLNPIFIVTLIPLFEVTLYPCLRHFKIAFTPLRRMGFGLFLAGVSFVCAGVLQIQIEAQQTPLPGRGEFGLRIINDADCQIKVNSEFWDGTLDVSKHNASDFTKDFWDVDNNAVFTYKDCNSIDQLVKISPTAQTVHEIRITGRDGSKISKGTVETHKPENGGGKFSLLNGKSRNITCVHIDGKKAEIGEVLPGMRSEEILVGTGMRTYEVMTDGSTKKGSIKIEVGAVYTLVIGEDDDWQVKDMNANTISVAWIFPQFFIITLGEVFLSITGLEFSYSQAPPSMKSVVTSIWLLTVSFGNVIVLIITGVQTIESQVIEFFLFAGLIFFAGICFIVLAYYYIPVDENEFDEEIRLEQQGKASPYDDNELHSDVSDKTSDYQTSVKPYDNAGFQAEITAL